MGLAEEEAVSSRGPPAAAVAEGQMTSGTTFPADTVTAASADSRFTSSRTSEETYAARCVSSVEIRHRARRYNATCTRKRKRKLFSVHI